MYKRQHLYDPFAALLEGYAVAGAAAGYMHPKDYDKFTVAGVRASWDVAPDAAPATRSTAEVAS